MKRPEQLTEVKTSTNFGNVGKGMCQKGMNGE